MGYQIDATCLDCGHRFTLDHDGGFRFHVLRCDTCGSTNSIGFDELGELHLRYLKGLPGPYAVATWERDEIVRKQAGVEPIPEDEYLRQVEAMAGYCSCHGKYKFDAPPRCSKCRSTRIEEGDIATHQCYNLL